AVTLIKCASLRETGSSSFRRWVAAALAKITQFLGTLTDAKCAVRTAVPHLSRALHQFHHATCKSRCLIQPKVEISSRRWLATSPDRKIQYRHPSELAKLSAPCYPEGNAF